MDRPSLLESASAAPLGARRLWHLFVQMTQKLATRNEIPTAAVVTDRGTWVAGRQDAPGMPREGQALPHCWRAKVTQLSEPEAPSLALPQRAFLRDRSHESTVLLEDHPASKPPSSQGARRVLGVEQPFVRAEGPVKPHRVVQAGRHHPLVEQGAPVTGHSRVEQREVRSIGQRAHMQGRIVGQFRRGPDPDMDAAVLDLLAEVTAELDWTQFDRAIGFVVAANEFRHFPEHRLLRHFLGGEFLRQRHIGHFVLMVEGAMLVDMERHHDREDRIAVLDGGNPAGRVALAVAQPLNFVNDRYLRIAGKNEIAVQRVRQPALYGSACGHHRLPDHLAAEHPLPARLRAVAAEQVYLYRLEIEDRDKIDQSFGHRALSVSVHRSITKVSFLDALRRRPLPPCATLCDDAAYSLARA